MLLPSAHDILEHQLTVSRLNLTAVCYCFSMNRLQIVKICLFVNVCWIGFDPTTVSRC